MNNYLRVRVIPRAKQNQISEILEDGTIKIRINAPPSDGKANKALIKYLSEVLNIPRSKIQIASGGKAREKKIEFIGCEVEQIYDELTELLKIKQKEN